MFNAHNRRCLEALTGSYDYFMNPPKKALLPPLPKHERKDFTVCIELSEALTYLVWDTELGWRVAIRPGVKEFLFTLRQMFEVVLYTDTPGNVFFGLILVG
jgi:import inner membrane translocase subunit TIM50